MSKYLKNFILISAILFVNFSTPAFAYFDPGTGSFIIQSILGIIAAVAASISATYINFKNLINKLFRKKKENNHKK